MSNLIKSCFVAVFILVLSGIHGKTLALDLTSAIHIYTPIELKPISYSQGVKLANVCSVTDVECREKAMMFDIADEDFITQCQDEGYTKTADTCPSAQTPDPGTQCPYLSTLYKKCLCDTSVYTHTGTDTSVCGSYNVTVNTCTDTSGTHFSCECNSGTLCDGETQYVLPSIMSDISMYCLADNGEKKYANEACLSCAYPTTLKSDKTGCECPSSFSICENGGEIGAEQCSVNNETLYSQCKACDDTCAPIDTTINIGDILYSDMSVSSDLVSGKTAIGIVFDATNRYAVALTNASSTMSWGPTSTDISGLTNCIDDSIVTTTCGTDVKSNTQTIIAQGASSYPAASYCNTYTTTGTSAGNWWLPSGKELWTIYSNLSTINAGLTKAGGSTLSNSYHSYYWSSTEYNRNYAWLLDPYNGDMDNVSKNNNRYARPVMQLPEITVIPTTTACSNGETNFLDSTAKTECGNQCYACGKCTPKSCSAYTLSSCPSNGVCSTCFAGCGDTNKTYKLDRCKSGYTWNGSECLSPGSCDGYAPQTDGNPISAGYYVFCCDDMNNSICNTYAPPCTNFKCTDGSLPIFVNHVYCGGSYDGY